MNSVYFYLTTISAILYVAVLFGSFHFAPEYLIYITSIIKIINESGKEKSSKLIIE